MSQAPDVLVVGAGPTGLTLAGELLRRGLRVRIIDKASGRTAESRAIAVHARTLEIFDDMGIAEEATARGVALVGSTLWAGGERLADIDFGALETQFPFVLSISQVETEAILEGLLERRGGRVERGVELVKLDARPDGVTAWVRGAADVGGVGGVGEERIDAPWVVGCDGAHSAVRKAIGGTFEGHTYEDAFVLADVCLDMDLPPDRISVFFADDGIVACFPMLDSRFRIVATATKDVAGGGEPRLEGLERAMRSRSGLEASLSDVAWLAAFRIHCRQVLDYRRGRVFLAGDAAHIHSPAGGQGMNTGIQDAHNLAWKLALEVSGRARPSLLESYHVERHAVGRALLQATDLATKLGTLHNGAAIELRNHVARFVTSFEPVRDRMAENLAELTIGYPDSTIVGQASSPILAARIGAAEAGETPTLASRLSFAQGPRPGARMPDGKVVSGDGAPSRLARVIRGETFTLLLFDGRCDSTAGYERLVAIARSVHGKWKIPAHVITRQKERPAAIPADVAVLLDVEGELEHRYAAETECLYLVRPDLYVGFRSQPADEVALDAHLRSLLSVSA